MNSVNSENSERLLRQAGWFPGRRVVQPDIARNLASIGLTCSPVALTFIEEFGGIKLAQRVSVGGTSIDDVQLLVDATSASRSVSGRLLAWLENIGIRLATPLGFTAGHILFVTPAEEYFAVDCDDMDVFALGRDKRTFWGNVLDADLTLIWPSAYGADFLERKRALFSESTVLSEDLCSDANRRLAEAGWSPYLPRDINGVWEWLRLHYGPIPDPVLLFLREFYRLSIQVEPWGGASATSRISFVPEEVGGWRLGRLSSLSKAIGQRLYPLGSIDERTIAMSGRGTLYGCEDEVIWLLGSTTYEALNNIISKTTKAWMGPLK